MSRQSEFTAGVEEVGQRIDRFLADKLEDFTRSSVQNLMEKRLVLVNGQPSTKNYKLRAGDCVTVELPAAVPVDIEAQNLPLDIIYEDSDLLVVLKPKGMVVHPAPGNPDRTLVNALLFHCAGNLSGIGGELRPGIVHRIDKDTSGLLVVAKNDRAHRNLQSQIQAHSFVREYEAVVYGNLKSDGGTVDAPIGRSPSDRKKMAILVGGRPSRTHYEAMARYPGFTHIRCRLETGRTHQIRVHMASIGHPVAGDPLYGPKKILHTLQGQCLHARTLGFLHPATGEKMLFHSDLPDTFTAFLQMLENRSRD